ncbi:MAG: class I SAM-dependent methyltransferase [Deltaproteobacteria bacterium]|nr:class I SAM-dependent methyltransferase [Deltaproteobacteria bacterium]
MDADTPHAFCDLKLARWQTMLDCHFIEKKVLSGLPAERRSQLSVLDVGAAKGRMTKEFARMASLCVALEPFPPFYQYLRARFENIEIHQKTLNEYARIADKKFDLIFISGVICYLTDDEVPVFLKNAYNLLKEDGFLIIRELCPYPHWDQDAGLEIIRPSHTVISFLKQAGFKTVSCHRAYPVNLPYKLFSRWPNRLTEWLWRTLSHKITYPWWRIMADLNLFPHQSRSYLHYLVRKD